MIHSEDAAGINLGDYLPAMNPENNLPTLGIFAKISSFVTSILQKICCFCHTNVAIQTNEDAFSPKDKFEESVITPRPVQKISSPFRSSLKINKENSAIATSQTPSKSLHFNEQVEYRYSSSKGKNYTKIASLMSEEECLFLQTLISNLELEKIIKDKKIVESDKNLLIIVDKVNLISQELKITSIASLVRILDMFCVKCGISSDYIKEINYLVVKSLEDPIDVPKSPPIALSRTESWSNVEL